MHFISFVVQNHVEEFITLVNGLDLTEETISTFSIGNIVYVSLESSALAQLLMGAFRNEMPTTFDFLISPLKLQYSDFSTSQKLNMIMLRGEQIRINLLADDIFFEVGKGKFQNFQFHLDAKWVDNRLNYLLKKYNLEFAWDVNMHNDNFVWAVARKDPLAWGKVKYSALSMLEARWYAIEHIERLYEPVPRVVGIHHEPCVIGGRLYMFDNDFLDRGEWEFVKVDDEFAEDGCKAVIKIKKPERTRDFLEYTYIMDA